MKFNLVEDRCVHCVKLEDSAACLDGALQFDVEERAKPKESLPGRRSTWEKYNFVTSFCEETMCKGSSFQNVHGCVGRSGRRSVNLKMMINGFRLGCKVCKFRWAQRVLGNKKVLKEKLSQESYFGER